MGIINQKSNGEIIMTEQEIFEKLKEALDYQYLLTNWGGF
jgi:hypothetical protein